MSIREANRPVADVVCRIIRENDLKQKAIAKKGGYSTQEVNDMLNGRRLIKIADVSRLALALNINPAELFSETVADDKK